MPARRPVWRCKEEGYEVVLVNSNPATIMTDTAIADKVYMEPLTLEYAGQDHPLRAAGRHLCPAWAARPA